MMNKQSDDPIKLMQSPDERLKLLHYRVSQGPFGQISVEGAVRNISTETLKVEIKADYLGTNEAYIGSEVETIKHLNPGDSTAFDVAYCAKNRYLIKDVKFSVKAYTYCESKGSNGLL